MAPAAPMAPRERRFMTHQFVAAVTDSLANFTYYAPQYAHLLELCGGDSARMGIYITTQRSIQAAATALLAPALGALSDTIGRRPLLALWNAGWLLRPLAMVRTTSLASRLVCDTITIALLGAGGPPARGAAFGDLFSDRPELSTALQSRVGMVVQAANLVSASVGQLIAARWGAERTFLASACFAAVSLTCVVTNIETLQPEDRRPLALRSVNPLRNIAILFVNGARLRSLAFGTLLFQFAWSMNGAQ